MKRKLLVLVAVLALVAAATVPAFAADNVPISCTVTPVLLSVQLSTTNVAYGPVALNSSDTSGSITATNNGSGIEGLWIRGTNATGTDATTWTLAETIGANQFVHTFAKLPYPGTETALTLGNQLLAEGIAQSASQEFQLTIYTPSSTTAYVQMTTTVTVVALAP